MVDLLIDWCDAKAARFACEHWHYSQSMPSATIKHGVWEDDQYIGCILYGVGANNNLGKPYGLIKGEFLELVRIALKSHQSSVTQMMALSRKILKSHSPDVKLLISFADSEQGHLGKIYQADNWLYVGMTQSADEYIINGHRIHGRSLRNLLNGITTAQYVQMKNGKKIDGSEKYRYLYPMNKKMRRQILPLSQPYPKSS